MSRMAAGIMRLTAPPPDPLPEPAQHPAGPSMLRARRIDPAEDRSQQHPGPMRAATGPHFLAVLHGGQDQGQHAYATGQRLRDARTDREHLDGTQRHKIMKPPA